MNWLLIVVILLLAGNIAWGIYRGFLRVVLSVAVWIVMLVFVTWAAPYAAELLREHTQIDERIEAGCEEGLRALVRGEGAKADGGNTHENAQTEASRKEQGIRLPEVIADQLLDTGELADHLLSDTGVYAKAAEQAANLALRSIAYVSVLAVIWLAFHILMTVLDLIAKLPVIEGANRLLGGAAGLVKGVLLVWLLFAFIALGSATAVGTVLISRIYESELLVWLYENNLVLTILMNFF